MANEQFAGLDIVPRKTSTEGEQPKINGLIYGDSDAGKTRFLGTAALIDRFAPVLHLDTETGRDTLDELPSDAQIDPIDVDRWSKLQLVYNTLYDQVSKGTCKYRTVTIDNGTYAQNLGILSLLGVEGGKFDTAKLAQFQDYNGSQQQMLRMVRMFKDLDLNFFMTAHAESATDPNSLVEKKKLYPAFTNKLMRQMPGMFSQVFYMYKEEAKDTKQESVRKMQTVGTSKVNAKCRRIKLPEIIDNPTMQMIADAPLKEIKV